MASGAAVFTTMETILAGIGASGLPIQATGQGAALPGSCSVTRIGLLMGAVRALSQVYEMASLVSV
tara:strand:- start:339 stop:536 length:198 start_codon:yes stop_codon:yes gene_type:complete